MFGPAPVAGSGRFFISTYDYRHPDKSIGTMSARGGKIHWVVPIALVAFLRYSPDGRRLLAYDQQSTIHLFQLGGTQPHELGVIDLGMSKERPNFQPVDMKWSPDGKRVMVLFSFKIFHQGVVRVYDAETSRLDWERSFDRVEMAHGVWSPEGRKLAVTLLSGQPDTAYAPRDISNLLVLDASSGQTILGIKTGDTAGPVCFAPDNTIVTAPLHFEPRSRDSLRPEAASVRSATTGLQIRSISSPGRDIHDDLELSQDGKILLAYVGKEKSGFSFRAMEDVQEVIDRKFQLFDYKTGNAVATSPDLTTSCNRYILRSPSLRLNADGDNVLVYWPGSPCSPSVFELGPGVSRDTTEATESH